MDKYYFNDEMISYFEPENVDSMAAAILKLYQDQTLRERQVKKANAFLERYGWETHKMELINLYRSL